MMTGEAASYPGASDSKASSARRATVARLTPAEEEALVRRARANDAEAIEQLLRVFQRRVYAVCVRMVGHAEDAADLTQDVLLKVLEGLPAYDGRSAFSTWVVRIAMNTSISALRRRRVRRSEDGAETLLRRVAAGEPGPERGVEQAEARGIVLDALDRIDPQMKAILVLRDMQDLEYQEIGTVLDVPIGTVKSRLFRARAALRATLEAEGRIMDGVRDARA